MSNLLCLCGELCHKKNWAPDFRTGEDHDQTMAQRSRVGFLFLGRGTCVGDLVWGNQPPDPPPGGGSGGNPSSPSRRRHPSHLVGDLWGNPSPPAGAGQAQLLLIGRRDGARRWGHRRAVPILWLLALKQNPQLVGHMTECGAGNPPGELGFMKEATTVSLLAIRAPRQRRWAPQQTPSP